MRYEVDVPRPGFVARLIRSLGPRGLLTWLLVLVIVFSATSGLTNAVPNLEGTFLVSTAIVGATLGWLLAQVPVKAGWAAALSFLLGVEYLLVRAGGLGGRLLELSGMLLRLPGEVLQWYWTGVPPNWGAAMTGYLTLWRDMGTLIARTLGWLSTLLAGSTAFDLVGGVLVWGVGVWIYSVWAGWVIRRHHNPLLGVLPASLLLSFVLSYTGTNPYILLPILGATLVLMALMQEMARESRWSLSGVDFSQGLWTDIALLATGLSIALVLAAAIAPSVSVQKISDWVREVTERREQTRSETVAEGLGLEQKPEPRAVRPIDSMMSTGLPQRHLIGSGPELSRQVVMIVQTGELPSLPEDLLRESAPRHYWRSITYDRYFGRGWSTTGTEPSDYEAGQLATQLDAPYLRHLRQTVRVIGPNPANLIHVDGTLISVDADFTVSWRPPGEMFAATTEAREYRADSVYPLLTEEQLQAASLDYPDWILSRYLQLPDTVPERVRALARELTATELTPYDRAKAIEAYLREFPYTLDVPATGGHGDIADYFLFELQEGYCDYYATSMVVLARAAGLPARMVIGYVSGGYDPYDAEYIVTEADAHAWPEIYFPEYGWIEFEPTGGRPPIVRSGAVSPPEWPDGSGGPGPLVPEEAARWQPPVVGVWALIGLGSVLLVIGVSTGIDSLRLMLVKPQVMVVRLQRRLRRYALRLRAPVRRGDTPHELAASLSDRVTAIATAHGFTGQEFVEPAADEIQDLTELYVHTWYERDAVLSAKQRRRAVWTWWRLRWRLWLAWLWRRSGARRPAREDDEVSTTPPELAAQKARARERLRPPPG